MKSILSNDKECYICHDTRNLEKHHIFGAYNRNNSEKEGCWIWLCPFCHRSQPAGIHHYKELREEIQDECQRKWEELNGNTADFRAIFGKSYKK